MGVFDVVIEPVRGCHVRERQVLCERGEDGDEGVVGVNGVDGRDVFFIAADDIIGFTAAPLGIAGDILRDERCGHAVCDVDASAAAVSRAVFDLAAGHAEGAANVHTATFAVIIFSNSFAILNGAAGHLKRAARSDIDTTAVAARALTCVLGCLAISNRSAGHTERAVHIDTAAVAIGPTVLNRAAVHDEQAAIFYQYAAASCSASISTRSTI